MWLNRYFIRHLYWPLMERYKGNRIRAYLKELQHCQKLSPEMLRAYQEQKLRALLTHAVEQVPAYQPYRELVQAGSGSVFELLAQLPPLTKEHFNSHRDTYLSRDAHPERLISNRTGGSTGEPTLFYLDRPTVEHYEAARWLGLSWHGIGIGDPSVMIWGSPIELNQLQSKRYLFKERWLKNRLMIPAYRLQEPKLDTYLQQIRRHRPAYLYGYASALALLAELMLRNDRKLGFTLKAVVSTAETLTPKQRDLIEKAFATTVVNEYGARDGGILSYQCQAGQMHVCSPNCYLEVVDLATGRAVEPGQRGALLVTDLNNRVMPRLRYQLGDVVAFADSGSGSGTVSASSTCPCGNPFPVLTHIDGRIDDTFVSQSGDYVHGHFFNHIARNLDGIRAFQITQHSPDHLTLKLVTNEDYTPEMEAAFVHEIHQVLGESVLLRVKHVDQIAPSASGKIRYAIREFPLPGPASSTGESPSIPTTLPEELFPVAENKPMELA
ncbi:phenylacetate--CoA ligase family protein [Brevibacillus dissolubilis]|uniref:phenylacetate--CoA ligase family protein n=1 Tax=Brevibacillus dissolubilis TaxID=1844116 RepID=UPI00210018E6|nr:phenylacetate--CoA ligase family protein [Brevibacillus dissolubilis]